MRIRVCWYKNAGAAGYAEAFRPVQSDSQTSEWYSYFENDVLVLQWNAKRNRRERIYISYDSTKQKKRIIKKEQMQQHLLFVVLIFTNVEQLVKCYLQIRKHNQM